MRGGMGMPHQPPLRSFAERKDPAILHDWPQHIEALMTAAKQWESASENMQESA
jgi:hypothetical protein